jgi:hypothetical protein
LACQSTALAVHITGTPQPAPTADILLVMYIPDQAQIDHVAARLAAIGYHHGWRVALMDTRGS